MELIFAPENSAWPQRPNCIHHKRSSSEHRSMSSNNRRLWTTKRTSKLTKTIRLEKREQQYCQGGSDRCTRIVICLLIKPRLRASAPWEKISTRPPCSSKCLLKTKTRSLMNLWLPIRQMILRKENQVRISNRIQRYFVTNLSQQYWSKERIRACKKLMRVTPTTAAKTTSQWLFKIRTTHLSSKFWKLMKTRRGVQPISVIRRLILIIRED